MKILLTIDLDNTLFDITPLYKKAWSKFIKSHIDSKKFKETFKLPNDYNTYVSWPFNAAAILMSMFNSKKLIKTKIIDKEVVNLIKSLLNNPCFEVYFLTDRNFNLTELTYNQIWKYISKDIPKERIINCLLPKIDIIKELAEKHKADICYHFDDKPQTILDIINENIEQEPLLYRYNAYLISNDTTPYNHFMHDNCYLEWKDKFFKQNKYKICYYLINGLEDLIGKYKQKG